MCWKRLLRVPWTERKSNQSILSEINAKYSLEGLMLKLQYFRDLMWRADSLEKTLILGKIESRRQSGVTEDKIVGWHHHLNGHEFDLQTLGDSEGQGSLVCCSPQGCKELDTTYWLNNNNSPESYLRNTQFSQLALWVGEGKYSTRAHSSRPLPPKGTEKRRNTCEVHSPDLTKTLRSNHRTLKHFSLPLPPPYY